MITIKNLVCPVCNGVMKCNSFQPNDNLSDHYGIIYQVNYKCNRCNTFLTTYTSKKEGAVINDD